MQSPPLPPPPPPLHVVRVAGGGLEQRSEVRSVQLCGLHAAGARELCCSLCRASCHGGVGGGGAELQQDAEGDSDEGGGRVEVSLSVLSHRLLFLLFFPTLSLDLLCLCLCCDHFEQELHQRGLGREG